MKKIIFGSIAALAIVTVVALNVNMSAQGEKLSDVSLANVEALADGETTATGCCKEEGSVCVVQGEKFYNTRPCSVTG